MVADADTWSELEVTSGEERYRLLVDEAPVPLYVHDGATILFANRACARMLACGDDELVGRPLKDIVHPDYWEFARSRIEATLRASSGTGFNAPAFARMLRTDGTIVPVELVAAAVTYEG